MQFRAERFQQMVITCALYINMTIILRTNGREVYFGGATCSVQNAVWNGCGSFLKTFFSKVYLFSMDPTRVYTHTVKARRALQTNHFGIHHQRSPSVFRYPLEVISKMISSSSSPSTTNNRMFVVPNSNP